MSGTSEKKQAMHYGSCQFKIKFQFCVYCICITRWIACLTDVSIGLWKWLCMHREDLSVEVIGKKEQQVLVPPMTNSQWNRAGNHSTPSCKPESGLPVSMEWRAVGKIKLNQGWVRKERSASSVQTHSQLWLPISETWLLGKMLISKRW